MQTMTVAPVQFAVTSPAGETHTVTIPTCGCCHRCTCPDFTRHHNNTSGYHCEHIHAVMDVIEDLDPVTVELAKALLAALLDDEDPCTIPAIPCPCACNHGGWCGGCGHSGCGGGR